MTIRVDGGNYTVELKTGNGAVGYGPDRASANESMQAFFKVTLHEIMPGIVSGAIMAFTMSLDDFVISYFVTGMDFVTLPVEIYTYTKKPIQPKVYAMFTLLFGLIFVLMLTMNLLQIRADKKKNEAHGA